LQTYNQTLTVIEMGPWIYRSSTQ